MDLSRRRRAFYTQSTRFCRQATAEYSSVIRSTNPTDPLCLEMESPLPPQPSKESMICTPPRKRWGHVYPFVFASYCNNLTFGSVTAILLILFGRGHSGNGLILPYIGTWLVFIWPLLILEHCSGQLWQGGLSKLFSSISPNTRGIGIASILLLLMVTPIHTRFLGEFIIYFYHSFNRVLPWEVTPAMVEWCINITDPDVCTSYDYCTACEKAPGCYVTFYRHAQAFYDETIVGPMQEEKSITFHVELFICVSIGVLCVFLISRMGLRLYGQVATFAGVATLIYFLFVTMFVPGSVGADLQALVSLFVYDKESFIMDLELWYGAVLMAIGSSGAFIGTQYTLASFNPVSQNVTHCGLVVVLMRLLTSILSGVCVMALAGHAAYQAKQIQEHIPSPYKSPEHSLPAAYTDYGWIFGNMDWCDPIGWETAAGTLNYDSAHRILFITFPVTLTLMTGAPIHCIFFFSVMIMATAVSNVAIFETIIYAILDTQKFANIKRLYLELGLGAVWLCCSLPFLINIPSTSYTGRAMATTLDGSLRGLVLPLFGALQLFALFAAVGIGKVLPKVGNAVVWTQYAGFAVAAVAAVVLTGVLDSSSYAAAVSARMVPFLLWTLVLAVTVAVVHYRNHDHALEPASLQKRLRVAFSGDAHDVRKRYNRILAGSNRWHCIWRPWSPILKVFLPILLVICAAHLSVRIEIGIVTIVVGLTAIACATAAAFGFFCPKTCQWVMAPRRNRWGIDEIPCKPRRAELVLRRIPFRFWEEFFPAERTWKKAHRVQIHRTR